MATDKNFIIKNGLTVGTTEIIDSSGNVDGRDVSADGSKLDGIAAGATNVSSLTDLSISDGTNGQVLTTDGSGNFSFQNASGGVSDIVDDTTPQLGGNLDTNGNDITFADNDKANFGSDSDLQIYHDGSHARLRETTGDFRIQTTSSGVNAFVALQNGDVKLYHAGSNKLSTASTGVDVTGGLKISTGGTGLALDSSSNAYMVIDRGASNRRGELVFTTASTNVLNAPPLSATTDWALGVSDSDELAGDAFYISTQSGATAAKMVITRSGDVGIGTSSPVSPLEIATTNKLGSTFTGTTNGEGLTVTQTDYTAGNYISLVEAAYDDSGDANPNVRIGAMFDGSGSNLAFGTSNSYSSGITNTAMFINSSGAVTITGTLTANFGSNQIYLGSDGAIEITRAAGGAYIDFKDSTSEDYDARIQLSGTDLNLNGSKIWTAGNDGSGSGLDADTVDGLQGTDLVETSDGTGVNLDTAYDAQMFGWSTTTGGTKPGGSGYGQGISIVSTGKTHNNSNNWITQLAFSTSQDDMYFRGKTNAGSWGSWHEVWHTGNDGSGSGLDADTVDGVHESTFMRKTANSALNMSNNNITNVNALLINDPGPGEGIKWEGGNLWQIYESPDNLSTNSSGNLQFVSGSGNGTMRMRVDTSGNFTASGNVTAYSDERLKDNIKTLDGSKVYEMRGVSFTKEGQAGSGVIAQELQKVAPELVNDNGEYLSVAYGNVVGYLIEAIKELKAEIEELKEK